jgi:serine/threonine protein kinase
MGVVHMDIKSPNILVKNDWTVKIGDVSCPIRILLVPTW